MSAGLPKSQTELVPLEEVVALPDPGETPFEHTAATLDAESLLDALDELPNDSQYTVLIQHYGIYAIDGAPLKFKEIGEGLNVSDTRASAIHTRGLSNMAQLATAQAIREPTDPIKPLTQVQRVQHASRLRQDFIRKCLDKSAAKLPKNLGEDRLFSNIRQEENLDIANLAYLVRQQLLETYQTSGRGATDSAIDKHELARDIENRQVPLQAAVVPRISHADYIRALHALERYGIIACSRNERGSVIKAVALLALE